MHVGLLNKQLDQFYWGSNDDVKPLGAHSEIYNADTVGKILLLCGATYLQFEKNNRVASNKDFRDSQ